jgi:hypothetical protein
MYKLTQIDDSAYFPIPLLSDHLFPCSVPAGSRPPPIAEAEWKTSNQETQIESVPLNVS